MQEPEPKRRKMAASSRHEEAHRFAPELRNMIFDYAAFDEGSEIVQRRYTTVGLDGVISRSDVVHSFYVDLVSDRGVTKLFSKDIVKVAMLADELLTQVVRQVLFVFSSPESIILFAESFTAHASVCTRQIETHVEWNIEHTIEESARESFAKWTICEKPHGRDIEAYRSFKSWMVAIQDLPKTTVVHIVFPFFWRDFRSLRGLSKATGLSKHSITFSFPTDEKYSPIQHLSFFKAQTIAAVKDMEVPERSDISQNMREILVDHGCTGFNAGQRPSDLS